MCQESASSSSHDVEEGEYDAGEDEGAESEVGEHEERDGGDAGERQQQVARQLVPDHGVGLPGGVDLRITAMKFRAFLLCGKVQVAPSHDLIVMQ